MASAGIESAISAAMRFQKYALDLTSTGIDTAGTHRGSGFEIKEKVT
jgi:hypothetical protein